MPPKVGDFSDQKWGISVIAVICTTMRIYGEGSGAGSGISPTRKPASVRCSPTTYKQAASPSEPTRNRAKWWRETAGQTDRN